MRYILFFFFFLNAVCFSQLRDVKFRHFSIEQGLSQSNVFCILQDRDGFMWFGTEDGLNRFDGYRFRIFKHHQQDTNSISSNFINTLFEDRDGRLWIGTSQGLNCFDPASEKFTRFKTFSTSNIETIYQDRSGKLWIGSSAGLGVLNDDGNFLQLQLPDEDAVALTLLEDSRNVLWIGTNRGLFAYDQQHFIHYRNDPKKVHSLPHNNVHAILEDRNGEIWIAMYGGGVARFDRTSGEFTGYRARATDLSALSNDDVNAIVEDRYGYLWIGTFGGGVCRWDPKTQTFARFMHDPQKITSMSHNSVESMYLDHSGILWVGTNGGGINQYDPNREKFTHIKNIPSDPNSLSDNMVYSFFFDDEENSLWVGTDAGGLNRWELNSGKFVHYKNNPGNSNSLSNNSVRTIFKSSDALLWIGSVRGGIDVFDAKKNSFSNFRNIVNDSNSLNANSIRTIHADRDSSTRIIWIGTNGGGLNKFDLTTKKFMAFKNNPPDSASLSSNQIRAVFEDYHGYIWIGTLGGGLNRFDKRSGKSRRYVNDPNRPNSLNNNIVLCVLEDTVFYPDKLWIGTAGGINVLDLKTETFEFFTEQNGLPNDVVYGIVADHHGFLWVSTNKGLAKFDPRKRTFINYDERDGLQSNEFNAGAYFKNKKGDIFFGGINGFNYFHPDSLLSNSSAPQVLLTDFQIFNESVPIGKNSPLMQSITHTRSIEVDYTQNVFSFEFAALNYSIPEKNQYAYMMEGFDKAWIYSGARRYVNYTNLDPGRYAFRVKAANSDGLWNEDGQAIEIIIRPPFWSTWWFRLGIVGIIGLTVFGGVRFREYYRVYRKTRFISHYKIIRKLGEGGMGSVFEAIDQSRKKTVALKVLREDLLESQDGIKRFLKEVEIGRQVNHPNVVRIFNAGSNENMRYIAMEMIEGVTLKSRIREKEKIEISEAISYAKGILEGLKAIHEKNIVHRDLKSDNIMIQKDETIKIMDFGLARMNALSSIADRGQLVGTLAYMSPEQTIGKSVDFRTDIYSFGVVLYEMLFGELPFHGDNEMSLIFSIHNDSPKYLESSTSLHALILRCIQREPSLRYQSVDEIISDLVKI
ncbi:protein kinase [bacterium]|nr:protein kinase [bacterium]